MAATYIAAVDFGALERRCMRRLGWSAQYTADVLREYRRFMELKVVLRDIRAQKLSPSLPVDEMWHLHVLDTECYMADCQMMLGEIFSTGGGGMPVDPKKAFQWSTKAAKQGNARAQYSVAMCHIEGLSSPLFSSLLSPNDQNVVFDSSLITPERQGSSSR